MTFFLDFDLDQINRSLKTRKRFFDVFHQKPFLGAITIDVDGKKIFQPENFTYGTISKIKHPLVQMVWLNENLIHVISPFKNEEEGTEKWHSQHIFSYPCGDYSPDLTMYLNENDQIRWAWQNFNFQFQKGEISVDKKQFVQSSLEVLTKANDFLSFLENPYIQPIKSEFSEKLADNKEKLSEYFF